MSQEQDSSRDRLAEKTSLAVTEIAKGLKAVGFYPEGHPALTQALARLAATLEEIPLPEDGLEIGVSKSALLFRNAPLQTAGKAAADLNRELYLRRASKIIFLPGQKTGELYAFLRVLTRDIQQIQDEGGIERALMRENVTRIWANRVDYEGLTELLKKEDIEEIVLSPEDEIPLEEGLLPAELMEIPPDRLGILDLLARIERETAPGAYRDCVVALCAALLREADEQRREYALRAVAILAGHVEKPPGGAPEIAEHARTGIREIATDALIPEFVRRLRERAGKKRREAETALVAVGERAVRPLLAVLAEEEDLLVRKSLVDTVVRIGAPAVPALQENLRDSRWYIVRNMLTIMGNLGQAELAPTVVTLLDHPDLRVKKEAIKALSKLAHPASVAALGQLCFHHEETVALTATAALGAKREAEAVDALHRRAVRKAILFPRYRLAHEAVDSLRAIGTEEALAALERILGTRAVWATERFRGLKLHALRTIARMPGGRSLEILKNARTASEKYVRDEARRILRKMEGER